MSKPKVEPRVVIPLGEWRNEAEPDHGPAWSQWASRSGGCPLEMGSRLQCATVPTAPYHAMPGPLCPFESPVRTLWASEFAATR